MRGRRRLSGSCTAGWARAWRLHQRFIPCEKSENGHGRDLRTTRVDELAKRDRAGSHCGPCVVMSPACEKLDALSDAGSSPGAVACSSHSFACAEGAGLTAVLSAPLPRDDTVFDRKQFKWALTMIEAPAEPPRRGYPKVRNICSRDVMKSRDVERGVFEGAVHPGMFQQAFLEEHSA